ncbi:AAA family ATPase [Acidianus sulfidivorans JP7]|uniref:ABC transporter domain-containing protein n=1 Tax=Acidianus sulfidivorans JP7 TaxID=619593 RepID=A0A2U9IK05_9CREN|nr:AAA family ATPase [Acidianus sulfidivorans]AWR96254.1 AAA family ATPase [Acidianus sulfidivorans JP7]
MEVAVYCGMKSWVNICDKIPENYARLDYNMIGKWLDKGGKGRYLIFGTDIIPYTAYEFPKKQIDETLLFKFLKDGGTVIWSGDIPFYYIQEHYQEYYVVKPNRNNLPIKYEIYNFEVNSVAFYGNEIRNTVVGELLEYKPSDSWRPLVFTKEIPNDLILISYKFDEKDSSKIYVPAWIYKYGKGRFVRVYDSQYVDANYVFSLPKRLDDLEEGIKLRNFRRFKDFTVKLPKSKVLIIVGDNNVGKTSLLEAIALASGDEENVKRIETYRTLSQKVSETLSLKFDDNTVIEVYINNKYSMRRGDNVISSLSNVSIIFPTINMLETSPDSRLFRDIIQYLEKFDKNIFYLYENASDQHIHILYKDRTDVRISDVGQGYRTLIRLLMILTAKNPEILLIDDMEAFALHPDLLEKVFELLLSLDNTRIIITTQSGDVIYYSMKAAMKLNKEKEVLYLLLGDEDYEFMNAEEVHDILPYEDIRFTALMKRVKK